MGFFASHGNILNMNRKLPKNRVAIIVFTLLEAFVLRMGIAALIASMHIGFLSTGLSFNIVAVFIALLIGYGVGWLIFEKLKARFMVHVIVAAGVILVSLPLSYWLAASSLRSALPY